MPGTSHLDDLARLLNPHAISSDKLRQHRRATATLTPTTATTTPAPARRQ